MIAIVVVIVVVVVLILVTGTVIVIVIVKVIGIIIVKVIVMVILLVMVMRRIEIVIRIIETKNVDTKNKDEAISTTTLHSEDNPVTNSSPRKRIPHFKSRSNQLQAKPFLEILE